MELHAWGSAGRIRGAARRISKPRRKMSGKGLTTHYGEDTRETGVSGGISTPYAVITQCNALTISLRDSHRFVEAAVHDEQLAYESTRPYMKPRSRLTERSDTYPFETHRLFLWASITFFEFHLL